MAGSIRNGERGLLYVERLRAECPICHMMGEASWHSTHYIHAVKNCQVLLFGGSHCTAVRNHNDNISLRAPALLFNWHLLCNGYVVNLDLIRHSKVFLHIDIQYPKVPKSMIWWFAKTGIGDFVSLLLWLLKSTYYKISCPEAKVGPRGL